MSYAVLFPGQGSQAVGMGGDVFRARPDLLAAARRVLGWDLELVCREGPEEELTRTERAQPALYTVAFALWEALAERLRTLPAGAAGHSLGEYNALSAAGVLGFEEGLRLVAARGEAMAAAAAAVPSGMAALVGADVSEAEHLVAACGVAGGRLWIANVNAPGQVVVAGGLDDLAWAEAHAREHGVRRVIVLKVAGAFHTPLMSPAAPRLEAALAAAAFGPARFPVWANSTAAPYERDPGPLLLRQLTAPVRFGASLGAMANAGMRRFVHIGPGDVTAGLARRSVEGAETLVVSRLDEVDAAAAALDAAA
ncbi:MAG: ACP S-malonyltransferase [Acidimicrobiia bacterium]|nr:ACP S-malonyltransferase [Acidimicrobiia bacterium]